MRSRNFYRWLVEREDCGDATSHLSERLKAFMQANPGHSRSIKAIASSGVARGDDLKEAIDDWRAEVGHRRRRRG